jgi:Arf-GAP/coiled-coil/ANK repeat/PH domain-containing protein
VLNAQAKKDPKLAATLEKKGWLGKANRGRTTRGFDHRKSRFWSVISDGKLFLYKEWNNQPRHVYNLLLCTVREARTAPERWCFEVISPTQNTMLQALSETDMIEWMTVAGNVTSRMLDAQVPRNDTVGGRSEDRIAELRSIPGNGCCADCKAVDPEWASISLGVIVCMECSGIHRCDTHAKATLCPLPFFCRLGFPSSPIIIYFCRLGFPSSPTIIYPSL